MSLAALGVSYLALKYYQGLQAADLSAMTTQTTEAKLSIELIYQGFKSYYEASIYNDGSNVLYETAEGDFLAKRGFEAAANGNNLTNLYPFCLDALAFFKTQIANLSEDLIQQTESYCASYVTP